MAAQAHRLLVHRHLIGEDGRLGQYPAETVVAVNEPLAKSYIAALKKLYDLGGGSWVKSSCYATDLARLPDVLTITKAEEDLNSELAQVAVQAHRLLVHRHLVGEDGRLSEKIREQVQNIE